MGSPSRVRVHDRDRCRGERDLPERDVYDGIPVLRLPFRDAVAKRDVVRIVETRRQIAALKADVRAGPGPCQCGRTEPVLPPARDPVPSACRGSLRRMPRSRSRRRASTPFWARHCAPRIGWPVSRTPSVTRSCGWPRRWERSRPSSIAGSTPPSLAPAPLPFDEPRSPCRRDARSPTRASMSPWPRSPGSRTRFPRLRVALAGCGPARADLEQQARDLGIAGRVDFLGRVPEVPPGPQPGDVRAHAVALGGDIRPGGARGGPPRPAPSWRRESARCPRSSGTAETGLIVARDDDVESRQPRSPRFSRIRSGRGGWARRRARGRCGSSVSTSPWTPTNRSTRDLPDPPRRRHPPPRGDGPGSRQADPPPVARRAGRSPCAAPAAGLVSASCAS